MGAFTTAISGQWNTREMFATAVILLAIITLHPVMDQPVELFDRKMLSTRFYVGVALAAFAVALILWPALPSHA